VRKKVLIIAYYWPPAGGPGVQRWLKFVKYLPDFDIEPIVFVPDNPSYPITDHSLVKEVPEDVKILRLPIKEPYKFAKLFSKKNTTTISKGIIPASKKQSLLERLMLFVRGNFFIPDARVGWVKPSTLFLSEFITKHNIKNIVTTGPPHSLHLIGLNLKQNFNLRWLADFRDPWTTIGYHKQIKLTQAAQNKHKRLEAKVLEIADDIIVTSRVTKLEFEKLTKTPIHVITNGFDTESVANVERDKKFTISHIGSLLSKRNPEILWEVLLELTSSNKTFKADFRLNLVGFVSEEIKNNLIHLGLSDCVNDVGYVSHKEAITCQNKSQVLLLIEIDSEDTRCIIPGKLFEYMIAQRPILAIGPEGSDVEGILKETQTGSYFNYKTKIALKKTILEYYNAYKNGSLETEALNLHKYHRKELTKTLSQIL
jgi:glycosyltransferase involved in cell wall biosynthesis